MRSRSCACRSRAQGRTDCVGLDTLARLLPCCLQLHRIMPLRDPAGLAPLTGHYARRRASGAAAAGQPRPAAADVAMPPQGCGGVISRISVGRPAGSVPRSRASYARSGHVNPESTLARCRPCGRQRASGAPSGSQCPSAYLPSRQASTDTARVTMRKISFSSQAENHRTSHTRARGSRLRPARRCATVRAA